MTHNHFYDGDAAPLTGKVPIQVRVRGGTMSEATLAGVRGVLNSFLGGARISLAQNLQKTVALPGGVTVRMHSNFGVVTAEVHIPSIVTEEEDTTPFYGGILIRPIYHVDESVLFGPDAPDFDDPGLPLPEAEISGATSELQGRPAVPGATGEDPTNWLVVQIARDEPLDDEPVRKGAVKIYRIKDPMVGDQIEVNYTPEHYLLSASGNFDEFYICGQLVEHLPALPIPEFTSPTEARLRTLEFVPESFERASKTGGIVIVAADRELYAINTRNRPEGGEPTWQLLASGTFDDPIQYLNSFGMDFTEETSPSGVLTITCSGSNGAGVCSGFRVIVTPVSGGFPTLMGEIFLMHDGSVPAVPNVRTYSASLDVSGTIFSGSTPSIWAGGTSSGTFPAAHRGSAVLYSVSRTKSAGATERRYDRDFGGLLPYYSSGATTNTVELESIYAFNDWVLGVVELFEAPDKYIQNFAARFSVNETLTMVTTQSGSTSDLRTTTTEFSRASFRTEGTLDAGVTFPPTTLSYSRTTTGVVTSMPFDPVEEWALTGGDVFRQIFWRRRAVRTAVRTPFGVESGAPSLAVEPLSGFRVYEDSEVEETTEYSAIELTSQLKKRTGAVLQEWPDAFARFDSTPTWAGPQTLVVDGGEKYAMLDYRTGPDPVTPSGAGIAAYTEWVPAIHLPYYAVESDSGLSAGGLLRPTGAGPTSFSYSYSFDGSEPVSYSFAEYVAVQPQSLYAYGIGLVPTTIQVNVPVGPSADADADTGGVADHLLNNFTTVDRAFYDIRTGGFIAQSIWAYEEPAGSTEYVTSLEAFIGNDTGIVPLRQVLDEWRALGELDPATDDKRIVLSIDVFGALL